LEGSAWSPALCPARLLKACIRMVRSAASCQMLFDPLGAASGFPGAIRVSERGSAPGRNADGMRMRLGMNNDELGLAVWMASRTRQAAATAEAATVALLASGSLMCIPHGRIPFLPLI